MRLDWERANALLRAAQQPILVTHTQPDGDAFGSLLGLGNALIAHGKAPTMAVEDGVTDRFRFLPNADLVRPNLEGVTGDLAIILDCSDERRPGALMAPLKTLSVPIINLDHHRTNTLFGTANLVDVAWVSTTEGALEWLDQLGMALTPETAQCLLCGLVTDTLCFRTDNVRADTLGKAQRLMNAGANLNYIVQKTLSTVQTGVIRLWSQVMPTVKLEDGVIWAKITQAARQAAGAPERGDGDLVNLLLQAEDAHISAIFREQPDGTTDVSLRAVPGFDVARVATQFGGGGHTLAAGMTLQGAPDSVEAQVVAALKEAARQGTPTFA
ncbi:MAG: bifunctional oligoribonuclease/PAP phosphatase NrnA [Anaerolineae bacterium]|nr:bifunctional oligoribonuclease/PAP phosphatase NrnA [Anaerolineae bacterium]